MAGLVRRISIRKLNPGEHPCAKPIRYRSELSAAPSSADPGRHVAWRALGPGGKDFPLLVGQVTFMAHSCVDAVKRPRTSAGLANTAEGQDCHQAGAATIPVILPAARSQRAVFFRRRCSLSFVISFKFTTGRISTAPSPYLKPGSCETS
jgi:hypothetical protein